MLDYFQLRILNRTEVTVFVQETVGNTDESERKTIINRNAEENLFSCFRIALLLIKEFKRSAVRPASANEVTFVLVPFLSAIECGSCAP